MLRKDGDGDAKWEAQDMRQQVQVSGTARALGPDNEIHPNYTRQSPQNVTTKNASMHLSAFELDCSLINDSHKNKT